MLCEGRLLSMAFDEELNDFGHQKTLQSNYGLQTPAVPLTSVSAGQGLTIHRTSPEQIGSQDNRRASQVCASHLEVFPSRSHPTSRQISPEIEIPAQGGSAGGDVPFLVPSFCQSICKNYSDLHIGGDQVLPLSANDAELRITTEAQPAGPFLQSCDVPSDVDDSLLERTSHDALLNQLRGSSSRLRQGSTRDRSFLFQGREGPFSNSLLNHYLEQKLLDLYQQYMMENMAREHSDQGPICPLLGSEVVLTSVDQITMKLSREGNLEAGLTKDMVLSCLLRVAGDVQSSEISTPFLQISNESCMEQLPQRKEE
ncbi:uncharacterized protein CXorf21 homolog [Cynoglossus semilaevis]|uniref:uncharacterized protein CXorf21 homolog n=1 Tax=Cynoglossus semilaevis TaxID=244447 RepID=UPI0004958450|nr:uncharacterized protein CXorf21 homolog [Cynoglossus semilaevis]